MEISAELHERINAFVEHVNEIVANYWKLQNFGAAPVYKAEYLSSKWCRIVTLREDKVVNAYAFICLKDGETAAMGKVRAGDIHKATTTFNMPVKFPITNVFVEGFNNCATPNGVVYRR